MIGHIRTITTLRTIPFHVALCTATATPVTAYLEVSSIAQLQIKSSFLGLFLYFLFRSAKLWLYLRVFWKVVKIEIACLGVSDSISLARNSLAPSQPFI